MHQLEQAVRASIVMLELHRHFKTHIAVLLPVHLKMATLQEVMAITEEPEGQELVEDSASWLIPLLLLFIAASLRFEAEATTVR